MNLQDVYAALGGNYDDVLARFGKEERVVRFLGLFLRDGSFSDLQKAVAENDSAAAFAAAHTLKGVALNMGLCALADSASRLTEQLRGGGDMDSALYRAVCEDYRAAVHIIGQLD